MSPIGAADWLMLRLSQGPVYRSQVLAEAPFAEIVTRQAAHELKVVERGEVWELSAETMAALCRQVEPHKILLKARWRTGRKVGRTLYAMHGDTPSDDDPLIGVMDTAELASEVADAHNGWLDHD